MLKFILKHPKSLRRVVVEENFTNRTSKSRVFANQNLFVCIQIRPFLSTWKIPNFQNTTNFVVRVEAWTIEHLNPPQECRFEFHSVWLLIKYLNDLIKIIESKLSAYEVRANVFLSELFEDFHNETKTSRYDSNVVRSRLLSLGNFQSFTCSLAFHFFLLSELCLWNKFVRRSYSNQKSQGGFKCSWRWHGFTYFETNNK